MLGSNNRTDTGGRRVGTGGPVGMIVKGIAAGIGLASESIHHHKEKKRAQKEGGQLSPSPEDAAAESSGTRDATVDPSQQPQDEILSQQLDEATWALDDAQHELDSRSSPVPTTTLEEVPQLADDFLQHHPPPATYDNLQPPRQLELPVVITQRRPKERKRGFVRAYAPALENVGIDQQTFLDFLDQFNKAIEPSPWIQAINLAGLAAQHVPEPVTIAIGIATKMIADAASEVHSRTKTNSFLDRMNEEFFKQRGLIALLLTWKPTSAETLTTVDFNLGSTIANESSGSHQGMARLKHKMQSSSAATQFEFPVTAPLIFPALDDLATAEGEQAAKKASAIKRSGNFVGEYMDKRAQAKWAGENPNSQMANALPKPEFYSRYADPNHPASSGDIVALLTGGYISGGRGGINQLASKSGISSGRGLDSRFNRLGLQDRQGLRGGRSGRLESGRGGRIETGGGVERFDSRNSGGLGGLGPLSLISGAKKLLQNDVLYLLIVNRPSEEEMAAAAAGFQPV